MDPHRLAEERSVAYHREIAERLTDEPGLLDEARARVEGWIAVAATPPYYARRWREILDQPAHHPGVPDGALRGSNRAAPIEPVCGCGFAAASLGAVEADTGRE